MNQGSFCSKKYWTVCLSVTLGLILMLLVPDAAFANSDSPLQVWPDPQNLPAASFVVYDRSKGEVILASHPDEPVFPASTTKVMTAVLALEQLPPDQFVTVSQSAVMLPLGSSVVGLKEGETIRAIDLITAMMVASGNDAANALAEAMDGSLPQFALRMNAKAAELGLTNTHFCNPSGLHDPDHLTTARDLAVLADYALNNEEFRKIVGLKTFLMPATNVHPYVGWALLVNSNRLILSESADLCPDPIVCYTGVKTGTTTQAGQCLVASAKLSDERELISAVMGIPADADGCNPYNVTRSLLYEGARIVFSGSQETGAFASEETAASESSNVSGSQTVSAVKRPSESSAQAVQSAGLIRIKPWQAVFLLAFFLAFLVHPLTRKKKQKRQTPIRPKRIDRT